MGVQLHLFKQDPPPAPLLPKGACCVCGDVGPVYGTIAPALYAEMAVDKASAPPRLPTGRLLCAAHTVLVVKALRHRGSPVAPGYEWTTA